MLVGKSIIETEEDLQSVTANLIPDPVHCFISMDEVRETIF